MVEQVKYSRTLESHRFGSVCLAVILFLDSGYGFQHLYLRRKGLWVPSLSKRTFPQGEERGGGGMQISLLQKWCIFKTTHVNLEDYFQENFVGKTAAADGVRHFGLCFMRSGKWIERWMDICRCFRAFRQSVDLMWGIARAGIVLVTNRAFQFIIPIPFCSQLGPHMNEIISEDNADTRIIDSAFVI